MAVTYVQSFTPSFQAIVVSSSVYSYNESFVSQISQVSLNHYYMLVMIKGQARPISFAKGNSMLSNIDSVLREL